MSRKFVMFANCDLGITTAFIGFQDHVWYLMVVGIFNLYMATRLFHLWRVSKFEGHWLPE